MYYSVYNPYSSELYHHGILGQKWGVRRYQYEDGSLTPEGKKRYYKNGVDATGGYTRVGEKWKKSIDKQKEKEYNKKNSWYNGLTEEQKKKFKKTMAIAGAVTLAAAAMYITPRAMKMVAMYGDDVVAAGETYGHIGGRAIGPLDKEMLYIAKGKDRVKYKGLWAPSKPDATDYEIKALSANKFAGKKNASKVFENYAKSLSDDELRNLADRLEGSGAQWNIAGGVAQGFKTNTAAGNIRKYLSTKDSKYLKKAYEGVNINLVSEGYNPEADSFIKGFKGALKSSGYAGIKDINDIKYSGYDTNSARILFDKSGVELTNQHLLTADELNDASTRAQLQVIGKQYLSTYIPVIGGVTGAATVSSSYKNAKITSKMNKRETLSDADKRRIRAIKANNVGMTNAQLAKKFGVSESTISYYMNGK